jgi:hypothetical protein
MNHRQFTLRFVLAWLFGYCAVAAPREIPQALQPWETWATWNDPHRFCPTPYSDPQTHRCLWPSRLNLKVDKTGAQFDFGVTVYGSTWLPLPGGSDTWPFTVRANGVAVPVLEQGGRPAVKLEPGDYTLAGSFRWNDMPQQLRIPSEIGVLELSLDGRVVEAPVWDAEGLLWLKRDGLAESGEKNFLSMKIYAVLEDGIPLWLRQEVELTVSGKSREEELGSILPAGWKLSSVESPIPVAVDEAGRMKVQVRAGKWTVQAVAFRLDDPKEFQFAPDPKPAVTEELVAFRARPDFRTVEILGSPSIDVSQTTFPEKWRDLPVYRWDTATPFRLEQRMRGMGDQKPAGLTVSREWWLDEDGRGLTFRDRISGSMQQIWRLDAADGEDLGSVRSGGQGQLITRNPQNGAAGVEIRTRNLNLEATGRMGRPREFPATGWRSDADSLRVTLNLPPGWRLFALFGADWVQGDWLTAWTLLDLFLLLILSLTVFRLWGVSAALLAFTAFGLSYHEPGAPRYLWLILLIPLALLRVVPAGRARQFVVVGKWITVGVLVLALAPFVGRQVQQAIYPQLEIVNAPRGWFRPVPPPPPPPMEAMVADMPAPVAAKSRAAMAPELARRYGISMAVRDTAANGPDSNENLSYDPKARIQTGPGVPEWTWRAVSFGWNGPVQASQQVRPILISLTVERLLTVIRVGLILAFAALLLRPRRNETSPGKIPRGAVLVAALLLVNLASPSAQAAEGVAPKLRGIDPALGRPDAAKPAPVDGGGNGAATPGLIPDAATLELLRTRLLEVSDAYPNAADIPSVSLVLTDRRLVMEAVIHTALRTAVPLPGRLPAWSPVTVQVDGKPGASLRRDDGFLWVVLPAGVHQVRVEGMLANAADWEWTFLLKPRQVTIEAPGWTVSGVRPDGVPEQQVFFAPQQKASASQASYERQELQTLAQVERHVELGLIGQVRTVVTRLSPLGKAVALRVPLLPGENVLSANAVVRDGAVEVRLGAQEPAFSWESGLTLANQLQLATRTNDVWVERWELVASPVWNVTLTGLAPFFDAANAQLVPVWQPWPGESVTLALNRPQALAGATVTVSRALHEVALGKRQRVSKLDLTLRCSLGEDFLVELPADAEVTTLTQNGTAIPVRKEGRNLVIPVRPGEQTLSIGWKVNTVLGFHATAGEVRLPVESANIETVITVPEDRWVLWTSGPRRGPAVRFWGILACSLLAAVALGRVVRSPLPTWEWMLLAIGLTQVPLPAAMIVVGWLFLLAWRGLPSFQALSNRSYNGIQGLLVGLTAVALGILLFAVGEGLLGSPEMFITGNGSTRTVLRWYQDRSAPLLPIPASDSISIWWFRFLMLVWALWLAAALIRWLRSGWQHFSAGGCFRPWRGNRTATPAPPSIPPTVPPTTQPG